MGLNKLKIEELAYRIIIEGDSVSTSDLKNNTLKTGKKMSTLGLTAKERTTLDTAINMLTKFFEQDGNQAVGPVYNKFNNLKKELVKLSSEINNDDNLNENKNKKMKRAKFKKPFYGMDNALKLIPESYKKDGNQFEITDGVETYEIRWDINEATVLRSENKNFINEDMNKIKHLMGFKSQDTLGSLKGKERIDENKKFNDVFSKSKKLISEGNWDVHPWKDEYNKPAQEYLKSIGKANLENPSAHLPLTPKEQKGLYDTVNDYINYGVSEGHDELVLGTGEDYELEDRMQRNYPRHDQGLDMADFNDVELGEESPIDYTMGMDGEDQLPNPPAEINIDLEEPMDRFDEIFSEMDEGEEFPDLNNDGEITQADILKGRGIYEDSDDYKYNYGVEIVFVKDGTVEVEVDVNYGEYKFSLRFDDESYFDSDGHYIQSVDLTDIIDLKTKKPLLVNRKHNDDYINYPIDIDDIIDEMVDKVKETLENDSDYLGDLGYYRSEDGMSDEERYM